MENESDLIKIDGSKGEGGGQILRSSLALSLLTRKPVMIENLRAGRAKPGLQRQHLASVRAAASVGFGASVEGDSLSSRRLMFRPGEIRAGEYSFNIGTAGSTMLVLQTILLPLLSIGQPSRVTIKGGTHNPMAPSADFIARTFLPLIAGCGAKVNFLVERRGFYPNGGGCIAVEVAGPKAWTPLSLERRGELLGMDAVAIVSDLPRNIADRELQTLQKHIHRRWDALEVVEIEHPFGPGNALIAHIRCEHATETVTAVGERGVRGEEIARRCADEILAYIQSDAPVGEHLADQLMLPLLLAGGSYITGPLSSHAATNLETIAAFVGEGVVVAEKINGLTRIGCARPWRRG